MERFSERIGAVKPSKSLQMESMNDALRVSIWNIFYTIYDVEDRDYWKSVIRRVAVHHRKVPVDELPSENYEALDWLKEYFFNLYWYQVYDLTEFLVNEHIHITSTSFAGETFHHHTDQSWLIKTLNMILEQELSGYRFIQGTLAPISNKVEVDAIEEAAAAARRVGLLGAQEHIRVAVGHLGKKPNPDYRNAIKEAISAVESVAKQITGKDSKTLDPALKELSNKTGIHGSLSTGFLKLYGYTSDENGIRHATLEQPNVGFAEAKYMIVSCSAFVHYLIQKADEAGLIKTVK